MNELPCTDCPHYNSAQGSKQCVSCKRIEPLLPSEPPTGTAVHIEYSRSREFLMESVEHVSSEYYKDKYVDTIQSTSATFKDRDVAIYILKKIYKWGPRRIAEALSIGRSTVQRVLRKKK